MYVFPSGNKSRFRHTYRRSAKIDAVTTDAVLKGGHGIAASLAT
jgi:hypothetical protein